MRKIIIFGILILIVVFGFFYLRNKNNKESNLLQMEYENVKRDDLKVYISTGGVVKAEVSAEVSPETEQKGAKIVKIRFDEGDFVKKGEILIELDTSQSIARLNSAEASLKASKAQLDLLLEGARKEDILKAEASLNTVRSKYLEAKKNHQRIKELFEKGFLSEKDKDDAQTNLDVAKNNLTESELQLEILKGGSREKEIERQKALLEQARANYEMTRAEYESTIIYSPISGVVTAKLMQEGQIVYPGSIIAKISDLNTLQVIADVDETDIGTVKIGDEVEIYFEALPDLKIRGIVSKISSEAKLKQDITYFEVTIDLQNKVKNLKPGMTCDVNIITNKSLNTLVVSSTAVKRDREGNFIVLLKNNKGKFLPQKIKVGLRTEDKYEISEGLKEGDIVVENYALIKKEKEAPKGILGGLGRGGRGERRERGPR